MPSWARRSGDLGRHLAARQNVRDRRCPCVLSLGLERRPATRCIRRSRVWSTSRKREASSTSHAGTARALCMPQSRVPGHATGRRAPTCSRTEWSSVRRHVWRNRSPLAPGPGARHDRRPLRPRLERFAVHTPGSAVLERLPRPDRIGARARRPVDVHGAGPAHSPLLAKQRGRNQRIPRTTTDRILADYETSGFGYCDYPGMRDWGDALVKPKWVRAAVAGRDGLEFVVDDHDKVVSWAGAQDVVTCVRRS